jgi:hypothetical protein
MVIVIFFSDGSAAREKKKKKKKQQLALTKMAARRTETERSKNKQGNSDGLVPEARSARYL